MLGGNSNVAEALGTLRQCVLDLYTGALGDGRQFHPLTDAGTRYAQVTADFHQAIDAVQAAVNLCGATWANQETQENSLRTYLQLSKDKMENEFVLGQLERAFDRIKDECEGQAARTSAARMSKEELVFETTIQNLKRIAKELSKITPLDFDIAFLDDKNAQVTLGSHGENFCFAIVVDLAKEADCIKSSSVFFLVDDGQWEDEDANKDLLFCLQNMKFGRLKLKLRSMLENELLHAKYSGNKIPVKLMRSRMNEFLQKIVVDQPSFSWRYKQQLEGPALRFFEFPTLEEDQMHRLVFLGPKEVPPIYSKSSDDNLAYLFLVQPDLWIPFDLARSLPCLFGNRKLTSSASEFMEKSYFPDLEEDIPAVGALSLFTENERSLKYSEFVDNFISDENLLKKYKSKSNDSPFQFENASQRGIFLSHIMILPENLEHDFTDLLKILRQQACYNQLLSSLFSAKAGEIPNDTRLTVDLSEAPSKLKVTRTSFENASSNTFKILVDQETASIQMESLGKTLNDKKCSELLKSSLSIPAVLHEI
jgi:uncharacterized protein YukE